MIRFGKMTLEYREECREGHAFKIVESIEQVVSRNPSPKTKMDAR